ncbi:LON peptidase substrate-binding domain-containing protein [Haliangium sp.]|uniref:LON peptidase substrate-binding domain-containing protein n=1 Tax=Haliangium sp. TaxID=2663208 RepID=UPI003D135F69
MSEATTDAIDESALRAVAMFPLPNVVLLPGALLPLHIFEPRYRDMTKDVLAGSGLLAMARLRAGAGPGRRPAVYPVLGVGRVIASENLDDGRYNLLVQGVLRAELTEELPQAQSYRVVQVRPMPDLDPTEPELLGAMHRKLITLCDQLSLALDKGGEQLRELARSEESPGGCADLVSSALITELDQRQRLLETVDPGERLALAIQHVGRLLTEFGPHSPLMS